MSVPAPASSAIAAPTAGRATALACLDDVDVHVGRTPVLRGLTLDLREGEVAGLVGANGSGKSTLLRVLATLLRPSAGRAEILGVRSRAAGQEQTRRQIALVGHRPALHPDLTVADNLQLVASLSDRQPDAVTDALTAVGLVRAADRPVRACSEGMKRRTELARVMITRPRLLLLDEAHAALDADARVLVTDIARDVAVRGGAAVLVVHDPESVTGLAGRILRLRAGRLHEAATG